MFKYIILFVLLPFYLFANPKPIIFAPLPLKDIKTIYNQFSPMIRYLENKLNRKIKLDYNTSYDELLQKFVDGKIDIAYLGPLPFIALESTYQNAIPLVNFKNKYGNISYTCSFVSFITNNFPLEETKNTKIALTQALSTCGYLFVNDVLKESNINIEDNQYQYRGRHDRVALDVITDKFKYGGLKSDIAKEYYHLGLKELKRSLPIPNFALVANTKTLEKSIINDIKSVMISIDKNELSSWHQSLKFGAEETIEDDYNHLRQSIKLLKIPSKGNFNEK